MDLHLSVHILRRVLIHFGKDRFEQVLSHLHGCIHDHVEDLAAVVGISGIAKERLHIEHLIQQELQISLRDEFFSHDISPFMM